jgi:hypothetical protein
MPPVTIRGRRKWDVDNNGVATHSVPGLDGLVVTPVNSRVMDKMIVRLTDEIAELTTRRDETQAEIDELSTALTGMISLRAQVTAEPA